MSRVDKAFDGTFSGLDVTVAVTPTLISTNAGAKRRFEPVRRQCYFEDEIILEHFPPQEGYRLVPGGKRQTINDVRPIWGRGCTNEFEMAIQA